MKKPPALLCTAALAGTLAAAPPASASLGTFGARVLSRLNEERAARGLSRLAADRRLQDAARRHSSEMVAQGYFSHDSLDGSPFWRRVRALYGPKAVGENLLWGTPGVRAGGAVRMWMASPGHRRNILDPSWRAIGIAALHSSSAGGCFGGQPVTVVTVDFGAR